MNEIVLIPCKQNGKWGFANTNNIVVIPCQYDKVFSFSDNLALVIINSTIYPLQKLKKCFINKKGEEVINVAHYDDVSNYFSEGLLGVKIENKYGYIDTNGQQIIEPQFDLAEDFSDGFAQVGKIQGYEIYAEIDYSKMDYGDSGKIPIYKFGFIDKTGKIIIPYKYEFQSESYFDGFAKVIIWSEELKTVYIDKTGKEYTEDDYNKVYNKP